MCIIYSKGEKSFCSSQKISCNQETSCLLDCEDCNQETGCLLENLEHKGEDPKVCSKFLKDLQRQWKISNELLEDWTQTQEVAEPV